jgi:hypothetical protein
MNEVCDCKDCETNDDPCRDGDCETMTGRLCVGCFEQRMESMEIAYDINCALGRE